MKMFKNLIRNQEGFTLLELIVVVAVIGILAAIIVPQVSDIQDDATENSVRASLANAQTALEQYKLDEDNTGYPADEDSLSDAGITIDGDYTYSTGTDNTTYVLYYDDKFALDSDDTSADDYLFVNSSQSGVQKLEVTGTTKPTAP